MSKLTQTFSALSDDIRLSMVERLIKRGELPAGDLTDVAPISAPAISRHLKVLREAGVVHQRVQGTHRLYSVRPEALKAISNWTMNHKIFWEASLDRLEVALTKDPEENTDA